MVLEDVVEEQRTATIDQETFEEIETVTKRNMDLLFVRGDGVILVSPPLRTGN
jgi:U6 snRNA-associated Sm-like protein LSm3